MTTQRQKDKNIVTICRQLINLISTSVSAFAEESFVKLNVWKYEAALFDKRVEIGGGEIFLCHLLWKRTSKKPGDLTSTLEVLGLFEAILVPW